MFYHVEKNKKQKNGLLNLIIFSSREKRQSKSEIALYIPDLKNQLRVTIFPSAAKMKAVITPRWMKSKQQSQKCFVF